MYVSSQSYAPTEVVEYEMMKRKISDKLNKVLREYCLTDGGFNSKDGNDNHCFKVVMGRNILGERNGEL